MYVHFHPFRFKIPVLFRYVEVLGTGGAQVFIKNVHNTKFCMCQLDVRIQYEREDPNVMKMQSLLQNRERESERERLRGLGFSDITGVCLVVYYDRITRSISW